jgi:hypothetical protein
MSFSYKENGYRCKNRKQTDMISIKGNVKGNFTISSKEERSSAQRKLLCLNSNADGKTETKPSKGI